MDSLTTGKRCHSSNILVGEKPFDKAGVLLIIEVYGCGSPNAVVDADIYCREVASAVLRFPPVEIGGAAFLQNCLAGCIASCAIA